MLRVILFFIQVFRTILSLILKTCLVFFKNNGLYIRNTYEKKYSYPENKKFDAIFEISSEGEYQQSISLIKEYLNQKQKILLVFCSLSVVQKCEQLSREYDDLNIVCLPLLNFNYFSIKWNPQSWEVTNIMYLCRYDFFPELILLGKKHTNFVLISASLKGYSLKNSFVRKYYRSCYQSFSHLIVVDKNEVNKFQKMAQHIRIKVGDLRTIEIQKRLKFADKKLADYPVLRSLFDSLKNTEEKLILGSLWAEDLFLIDKMEIPCVIFPHDLGEKNLNKIESKLESMGKIIIRIDDKTDKLVTNSPNCVYLINIKGILCESYRFFKYAYIGGGFGTSIHSVLEPYLAGCRVFCGPNIHRSSEYDFIKANDSVFIKVVQSSIDFDFSMSENRLEIKNISAKEILDWVHYA